MRSRGVPLALMLMLTSGCLGVERTFPDESTDVTTLRVNAYAETDGDPPTGALVEVEGIGADGEPRAFHGSLLLRLERQRASEGGVYEQVGEWRRNVTAADFANVTSPRVVFELEEAAFPRADTYRALVWAEIDGRVVNATALFDHPGPSRARA